MIFLRELTCGEIDRKLFENFRRHQVVSRCWRKVDGIWSIRDIAFVDDWTEKDYTKLVECLKHTLEESGMVMGAFCAGQLKGFVSVESRPLGKNRNYLDLSSIHVSEDRRRKGLGRELFMAAARWAKEHGAEKLYISAHSAVESQAFYRAMGCREAEEYDTAHAEKEPCDCQLEYRL